MEREVLTSSRTYYVSTIGSDSNDGLSTTTPFGTLTKALDVVPLIDPAEYEVVIQLGTGSFAGGYSLPNHIGSRNMVISGSPTFGATIITGSIESSLTEKWTLKDFEMRGGGTNAIYGAGEGGMTLQNVQFGTSTSHHVVAYYGGNIYFSGSYRIVGNPINAGSNHIFAGFDSYVHLVGLTCSLVGTRNWPSRFIHAFANAKVDASLFVYSGSATGIRWAAVSRGTIYTNSVSTTFFPGNVTGSAVSGGLLT
jgi:hypothetical protein